MFSKLFKSVSYILCILSVAALIYFLIGMGNSVAIFRQYESIKPSSSANYPKSLQFLTSYTIGTGDNKLALKYGLTEDDIYNMYTGTLPGMSDGDSEFEVPADAQEFRAAILAAQGNDPGGAAANEKVFKLLYPNTNNTYAGLSSFNSETEAKIRDMNSGAMSKVSVEVWQWAKPNTDSLEKVSKTIEINCCTSLHPVIKAIFAEIYADPSQPVIVCVGGYSVRSMNNASASSSRKTSTHSYGGTLDINYNDQNGVSVSWNWNTNNGSKERPYPRSYEAWSKLEESQYKYECLYEGCVIVNTFEKYGLRWGGNWSEGFCDPMHFSIFDH